jgi:prepilin-type N-terminal cleavage/methylation domain-containing protein
MPFPRANAEMEMTMRPLRAFTLIELLVVIVIIAVLMGLAFPVFQSIQNQAKKTQAKNDVTQIVTAVNAFYTEYGKYPVSGTLDVALGPGGTVTNGGLFKTLRGLDTETNPRQVVFISPPDASDASKPKSGISKTDNQFYDPWGSAYAVAIDTDYDNQITPNPYGDNNGAGTSPLRQTAIAWSLGKDQALGKRGNKIFTGSDDVISWQ